jgi:hypothetical protein
VGFSDVVGWHGGAAHPEPRESLAKPRSSLGWIPVALQATSV